MQKARGHPGLAANGLPQLVGARFQVLFHSPPGVLFTFPSRYFVRYRLPEYLALGGGPPSFPQDFTCPAVLRKILRSELLLIYGTITLFSDSFQSLRLSSSFFTPHLINS